MWDNTGKCGILTMLDWKFNLCCIKSAVVQSYSSLSRYNYKDRYWCTSLINLDVLLFYVILALKILRCCSCLFIWLPCHCIVNVECDTLACEKTRLHHNGSHKDLLVKGYMHLYCSVCLSAKLGYLLLSLLKYIIVQFCHAKCLLWKKERSSLVFCERSF